MPAPVKLNSSFYLQENPVSLAKQLIGKVLVTEFNGVKTSGIICETEAYAGIQDKASHAYGGRFTPRTKTMYLAGGVAYVYLCYGVHHLFNVVTNTEGIPHAILIRGILPLEGIPEMTNRIGKIPDLKGIYGPGKISKVLGISTQQNTQSLIHSEIWIEDRGFNFSDIVTTPRIGVDYAEEDAQLPYRFVWKG